MRTLTLRSEARLPDATDQTSTSLSLCRRTWAQNTGQGAHEPTLKLSGGGGGIFLLPPTPGSLH
eukprot:3848553-Rhodomonas_salina.1